MIDVHVLHLPDERADWRAACDASLIGHPIVVHHLDGIRGDYFAARRRGFAAGNHSLVSYVDPDDTVEPNAFAFCASALDANPNALAVYTECLCIRENNSRVTARPFSFPRPHQLIVARRSFVESVIDKVASDVDLWHVARKTGHVLKIPYVGYVWRDHSGGHHRSNPQRLSAHLT